MRTSHPDKLGASLKTLRGGMSLREAAAKAGLDFTYLSKIENNHELPSWDAIKRLLKLYGEEDLRPYAYWQLARTHRDQLRLAVDFAKEHSL